jgi:Fe-S cluster biosynthesis and repair protein YggX
MACHDDVNQQPAEPVSGEHMVKCVKFGKEMPGLDEPPFDGELGQRVYDNVSREAWKLWLEHLKMVMNEYRLNPATREAQEIILKQMDDYFFGEGSQFPPGYVPPQSKQ